MDCGLGHSSKKSIRNRFQMAVMKGILVMVQVMACVGLQSEYYQTSCPNVQTIVRDAVRVAFQSDNTVAAALLRLHFHDCFVRGCDGSVLIDSSGRIKAEKDGPPNLSLHAFFVIDNAKAKLESACPATVSCADILALTARDAIILAGGPDWEVPLGRKDGKVSRAKDTTALPAPTFNISQLLQSFSQRGLSAHDLVALAGGHTLGFSHCSSFRNRIHNFSNTQEVDPSLHPTFAETLRKACPVGNTQKNAGALLDSTATRFDNQYYKNVVAGKGLFSSDAALYTDGGTKQLAHQYAASRLLFYRDFVKSMVKMSSIPGQGSEEVRLNCRKFN
ncbi:peroxidase 64 [Cryptomeria japonica]|uniref:peroxidase 64 n=1 Tax=Cryptomeria japonica TaxID=3369 RepID=UPI0027DAACAB|nr:peroxidase 64 [Cryptomeria japonica]